ncbi:MAG: histidine kinase dimerization/phospho-acceptor domain-containing protein [Eubacteriales bacterium]
MNKKRKISIRSKLLIVLAVSLVLAALVFYLVYQFGNFLVWRYYLGEANKQERAESYVEEFQDYVTKNMLSVDDTDAISGWSGGRYVDLIVYKDSNLIYAPDWFEDFRETDSESAEVSETAESLETAPESGSESAAELGVETAFEEVSASEAESGIESASESDSESESETDKSFFENWFSGDRGFEQYLTEEARKNYRAALEDAIGENGSLHPVYFVDGTLIVAVVDFTEEMLGNVVIAASIVCGLAVIAVIMVVFYGNIMKRIRLLQKNVRIIEEGDLDRDISQSGNDEISLLARDVGSMRDSIVDNMTRERRAWEANAGLITAMSHDIRTPLTVLLGYLDLIEMQNSGEISAEYIEACRENALRLKNLSDDMFSYFLVFGRSESELNLVGVNVRMLTEHIVSEYSILLSERGYKFKASGRLPDLTVKIDERYFRRVIDNIFSNIIKYADVETAVELCSGCGDGTVTLSCKNKIRTDRDIPESNGIGLKTCMKMMEEMGGELKTEDSEGFFTVTISLPVENENDKSDS